MKRSGFSSLCGIKKGYHITAIPFDKNWQRLTLPPVTAVPSALMGLTSLFGMGRGGLHRYNHHKICLDINPGLNFLTFNMKDSHKNLRIYRNPSQSLRVISTAQL